MARSIPNGNASICHDKATVVMVVFSYRAVETEGHRHHDQCGEERREADDRIDEPAVDEGPLVLRHTRQENRARV